MASFKEALSAGKILVGGYVQTQSPELVEAMGYAEFDFVVLDTEHTAHGYESVIHQLRAAEVVGLHPLIRPPGQEPSLISRAFDLGATGVFVPIIDNAEQARNVVKAAKYHPYGQRGICVAVKPGQYGKAFGPNYFSRMNEKTCIVAMVESITGCENIEEIMAVDGIDVVFIGPTDLSQSLGVLGEVDHPEVERYLSRVEDAAKKFSMPVGIHIYSVDEREELDHRIEQGFQLLTVMLDTALFYQSCVRVLKAVRPQ